MVSYECLSSSDQREEWITFFEKVDKEQRLPAEPIPSTEWIPESAEDVDSYMQTICKPKSEVEKIKGNVESPTPNQLHRC